MNFKFDKKQLYEFLNLSLTFITIQICKILPLLVSTLLISLYGNDLSLSVYGISNTIIALFYILPTKAIVETLEINIDKCFEEFKKNQIADWFWKSVCLIIILNVLIILLIFQSDLLLIKLNFEIDLVLRIYQYLCWSTLYIFLQGFNILIQGFYSSTNENNIFRKINFIQNVLLMIFLFYFIQVKNCQEYGYIYSKILQEIFNCICSVYVIRFQIQQDYLFFPKMYNLVENTLNFLKNSLKSFVQHFRDFLCTDFSIYMVVQFRDVDLQSAWIIFISIYYALQMISYGFALCVKFMIRNYSQTNIYYEIKQYFLPLLVYISICSILLKLLIYFQKEQIAIFFSYKKIVQQQIIQCLNIGLINIYPEILSFSLQTILQLLKEDQHYFYSCIIFDSLYTLAFSYLLCFICTQKLKGFLIVIISRNLLQIVKCILMLRKIQNDQKFDFFTSQFQEELIQMQAKNEIEEDQSQSSSEFDESLKINKK